MGEVTISSDGKRSNYPFRNDLMTSSGLRFRTIEDADLAAVAQPTSTAATGGSQPTSTIRSGQVPVDGGGWRQRACQGHQRIGR